MKKLLKSIDGYLIRFVIVGTLNTLLGTGIMFFLYNIIGAGYWVSSIANYVVGSVVSYFLNKNFTFKNKDKNLAVVIKFIINIAVCYFVAYGVAQPLTRFFMQTYNDTIKDNVAMVVGMVLYVGLNYLGQRYFAFTKKK